MCLLRRFIINFSRLAKWQSQLTLPLTTRKLCLSQYQIEKQFVSSGAKFDEVPSSLHKYGLFPENGDPIVLDVEEERKKISAEEVDNEFEGIGLKWGTTGVIDVEEVVELLRREKGEDICVARIPQECNYADYMVFVTGRSQRHMFAMGDFIRRLYKKRVCNNKIPHLEGKNSKVWMAIDLGNIILHVFSASGRKLYDLETLWTIGKDFDTISHSKSTSNDDDVIDYAKVLASLTPNT